ncbi:hypothetical protein IWQ60_002686 [Tieghemiomyces parasiticus]|uniref:C3H1-type domain-containing protein n=1 Tax=Tieghemiomyces parasiticus TaxID=78921 RepID=A0A9W8AEB3_9FUNG|nr:hypothetical protein IWQ60_002686 [Tieghemiomyces parasiticus]
MGCKGPCNMPKSASDANNVSPNLPVFQRGQVIQPWWNRMNHPGGFVRFAFVPFSQSDDWDAFNSNVAQYTCYEKDCGPDDPGFTIFEAGNGPGNGKCSASLTIPTHFPDNTVVTLQWIWFGGGVYYAQPKAGFGEYYSCTDLVIKGGAQVTVPHAGKSTPPPFVGKDYANPKTEVCKYWSSNKVGDCSFGDRKPSPVAGNLLSQSLEPCVVNASSSAGSRVGKPFGY